MTMIIPRSSYLCTTTVLQQVSLFITVLLLFHVIVPISCFQFHHEQHRKSYQQSNSIAFVHMGRNQVQVSQIQQQQKQLTLTFLQSAIQPLYSTKIPNGRNNQGKYSYTEGDVFQNEYEELDSLGGDPDFLTVEDTTNETKESISGSNNDMTTSTTNQKTQLRQSLWINEKNDEKSVNKNNNKSVPEEEKIQWEWDGEVDEEAHLGYE